MKKVVLIMLMLVSMVFGIEETKIEETMKKEIENVLSFLMKDKNQSMEQVYKNLEPFLDFDLMAKISLGSKNIQAISNEDKEKYTKVFIQTIKQDFFDKLKLYSDEKVEYGSISKETPQGKMKDDKIQYDIQIISAKNEKSPIIFKFYNKNNDWKIYDMDILGVSYIQTYKTQINEIFNSHGINGVIKKLSVK